LVEMKTGRRLGVLTIAVSGLLVAGLLFSAPAFAWDTDIKHLETSCPPGSDKASVAFVLELFEKGHSGHVKVSYTIGDVTNQGPEQDFGPDDQLLQFEFSVPSPAEDTTIQVHTKTFFDDSDHTPESSAEADLKQCQKEEESNTITKSTEAPNTTVEAPRSIEAPTTVLPPTTPAAAVAASGLPRTGSNAVPMLIAGLVMLAAGGAALFATRVRGRHAR
jgi:LPXTG-motif cell wall-anchored protein